MRKKSVYAILLIIPFLTIVYSILLKHSVGSFYLNSQYDPSYVYLINSLNISELDSPGHVDHPGTPLQITGAFAIKALYLLKGTSETTVIDVLKYPEFYLDFILGIFLILNSLIIFIAAIIIYKSTDNILAAFLIQLSPFLSFSISYSFFVVSAEIFLIPVSMLLIAFSLKYIFNTTEVISVKYILIFSVICGLGLAVKINFLPLLIIPLILLNSLSRRFLFIILTLTSFLISIIPAISKSGYFIDWVVNLFRNQGIYGTGKPGIIFTDFFIGNFLKIISNEILITLIYLIILLTLIAYLIRRHNITGNNLLYKTVKLLFAIFLSMTFQIVMVSKHFNNRYMLPGLILAITGLYLSINVNKRLFPGIMKNLNLNYVYLVLIFLISGITIRDTYENYTGLKMNTDNSHRLVDSLNDKLKEGIVINSFGCSSEEYALAFSTIYAGKNSDKYKKIIEDLHPDNLYFESWNKNIYSLSKQSNINSMLHSGKKIYIRSTNDTGTELILEDLKENYNINDPKLSVIDSASGGEAVYELIM